MYLNMMFKLYNHKHAHMYEQNVIHKSIVIIILFHTEVKNKLSDCFLQQLHTCTCITIGFCWGLSCTVIGGDMMEANVGV